MAERTAREMTTRKTSCWSEDFLQIVMEAFEKEASCSSAHACTFSVAGKTIRTRFLEKDLQFRLQRALRHLPDSRDPFDLEITAVSRRFLDGRGYGPAFPKEILSGRWSRYFSAKGIMAAFDAGSMALTILDPENRKGLFYCMDTGALPAWEDGAPFRILLNLWFGTQNLSLIHAGAVGTGDSAVLLAGPGGSGKSSVALACCAWREMIYLADDYCLVDPKGVVHSLYSSGKLERKHAQRFPHLGEAYRPGRAAMDKDLFFPLERTPQLAGKGALPVKAILVPKPGGATPSFEPLSPALALRALGPSTLFQMPCDRNRLFRRLATLVRSVPCYTFRTGSRLQEIGPALGAFLEEQEE
jgi:hypothetical protein